MAGRQRDSLLPSVAGKQEQIGLARQAPELKYSSCFGCRLISHAFSDLSLLKLFLLAVAGLCSHSIAYAPSHIFTILTLRYNLRNL